MGIGKIFQIFVYCMIMVMVFSVSGQQPKSSTYRKHGDVAFLIGQIKSIQINNLNNTDGLSKEEKTYVVNVVLESAPETILGFDLTNSNNEENRITAAWLELLNTAFINGHQVELRWKSGKINVKKKGLPDSALVLSVRLAK